MTSTETLDRDEDEVLAGLVDTIASERFADTARQLDLANRLAALTVRRLTNQHGCTGPGCHHPNHRRDVHYCLEMLDTLGLDHRVPVVTTAEREEYVGGMVSYVPRGNRPQGANFGRPRNNRGDRCSSPLTSVASHLKEKQP